MTCVYELCIVRNCLTSETTKKAERTFEMLLYSYTYVPV